MVAAANEFVLPYPPSANHYWRMWRNRIVIGKEGRAYRTHVRSALQGRVGEPLTASLAVHVVAFPPDRRRRDIDNVQKALLDALEHAGVFRDDSQIVWLLTEKAEVVPGGKVIVTIRVRESRSQHAQNSTQTT